MTTSVTRRCILKHVSIPEDTTRKFLADARADAVSSKVEMVRSDNGGGLFGGELGEVWEQYYIKQAFNNTDSSMQITVWWKER